MVTRTLGPVTFSLAEYRATGGYEITRNARHVRQEETDVFLLQLHLEGGKIGLRQDGRESMIEQSGDFSILDDSIPSVLYCPPNSSVRAVTAAIPKSLLEDKVPNLCNITAVHVSGQNGAGRLLSTMVAEIAPNLEQHWLSGASAARLSNALVDLLSVALLQAQDRTGRPSEGHASLVDSIYRFVEKNLASPELTPRLIADVHHISVRYLHRLFENEDSTLAEWIRARRLDGASRQLIDPAFSHIPVSNIGANWGFSDPSTFSRAFRSRFGAPPRDYRTTFLVNP
ncbi:MAG: helix-turn-helix domain-containing protein [Kocuria sp.]|nr:helix-turn-helix domain-containing protein [Kocuria sp.]